MRVVLVLAFLFCSVKSFAQQDYFYAETLMANGQHAEADRVLNHLIDSGAYVDRPRFAMMTLNLAGFNKQFLKDTAGARKCFESVLACYDTLSPAHQADNWNHREYYRACEDLAQIHYASHDYAGAKSLLVKVGPPGQYYSVTGSDVLAVQDSYYGFFAHIYEKLNHPDSAFMCIRKIRDNENRPVRKLDSIFEVATNNIGSIRSVRYSATSTDPDIKSPGYLYFVAWNDDKNNQHSIWFVNPEFGKLEIIGESTYNMEDPHNFPANCYDMSLSPDEKYLAVTCYTEGSNTVDIFSFPEILDEQRCVLKQSVLAYPASVEIIGWEQSLLILECDRDLTRLNKKLSSNWYTNESSMALYLFDVESGKYTKK